MKKLKEKIVDFRKRHAKGLEKFNNGLNWFLIVIVTFIVGLFLVGTIKGCSDSLKNNHTDNSSVRLVDNSSQIKLAHAESTNFDYFTFNSQLLPSNQSWSNSAQLFKLSSDGFSNFTRVTSSNFATDKSLQSPLALTKSTIPGYYSGTYIYYFGIQLFTINVDANTKLMSAVETPNIGGVVKFNMSVRSSASSPVEVISNCPSHFQITRDSEKDEKYIDTIQNITFKFSSIPSQSFFLSFYVFAIHQEAVSQPLDDDMFDIIDSITSAELNSALYSNQKYVFFGSDSDYDYGFNTGYSTGYNDGSYDGFNSGYDDGYGKGSSSGYSTGYNKGYSDGSSIDQKNTLQGLFLTAFQSPFHLFQQMFSVNVLGLNLGSLLSSLIILLICGFIVKRFI